MPDPDFTILGIRIAALQKDVRDIKFAADVDRQARRVERDVPMRQLGLFQGKVEAQLTDLGARLDRIETMLADIARKLDA